MRVKLAVLPAAAVFALLLPAVAASSQGREPVRAGTATGRRLLAPPVQENFSMVVFGDRTGGPREGIRVLEEAVRMTNRLAPDFVMTVGDLVQGYNRPADWMAEMRALHGVMKGLRMPWYPVVGNHDVYGGRHHPRGHVEAYQQHFGPRYYSFDYRFAHLIALDSDESLSFADPAVNQNMSEEQLAWLRKDLASTRARIVFCFLHHPRWTSGYAGCNWPRVHEILRRDGRVKAVFAGHIHQLRDDGVRDGIHYYTLATTGGHRPWLRDSAAIHHVNHVRVWEHRIAVAVIPVGQVLGGDVVLGTELDEMHALARGDWLELEGEAAMDATKPCTSRLGLVLTNPCRKTIAFRARALAGKDWKLQHPDLSGELAPGKRAVFPIRIEAPVYGGRRPALRVEATLTYRLKSGLAQPIDVRREVRIALRGVPPVSAPDPERNQVLALDGRSAVRVDLPPVEGPMTLECWARGAAPRGRAGLVTRTQNANFGLFWTPWPCATVYVAQRGPKGGGGPGYLKVEAARDHDWSRWNHLALTFDGRACRLWVNGVRQGEDRGTGPLSDARFPLFVGADPDGRGRAVSFFTGVIDEVRLSSVCRYAEDFEPARRFARDEWTRLLLHFDGDLEGLFADDSGRDHHGWAVGHPRRVREPITAGRRR